MSKPHPNCQNCHGVGYTHAKYDYSDIPPQLIGWRDCVCKNHLCISEQAKQILLKAKGQYVGTVTLVYFRIQVDVDDDGFREDIYGVIDPATNTLLFVDYYENAPFQFL